ncbi:DUF3795 domain-containing protein [Dehalogenimonas sp. 4OHTPN]|uniref:DUF3795 domain-containing protein n=1 Tax=Dehalogenimonas sp. 4OHTPN TaxID=3166643 RepID=A0AAU8G9N0_9CHLR
MGTRVFKRIPAIGACGLDCGLCPRYHTDGPSRCPGCAAEAYISPGCSVQRCCVKEHHMECCAECPETQGCARLDRVFKAAATADSFISYLPVPANHRRIRETGISKFARMQEERAAFLAELLATYNDGRSKGFFCLAVQLLALDELQSVLGNLSDDLSRISEMKGRTTLLRQAFSELASQKGLTLKLRRRV